MYPQLYRINYCGSQEAKSPVPDRAGIRARQAKFIRHWPTKHKDMPYVKKIGFNTTGEFFRKNVESLGT